MPIACMPSMARIPIEKIKIPTSASSSMTPFCCDAGLIVIGVSPLSALARIVRGGNLRVAHARLSAPRDQDAHAAHGAVGRIGVLAGAGSVGHVDLADARA